MRWSRTILGLLLLYQAFFLNVVLPGHTRGAVTVDGKHAPACCCCHGGAGERRPANKGPAEPSQRDRDHCAVCDFAAGLTSVPVVVLTLPALGLLDLLPVPPPAVAESRDRIATYLACGPPLSSTHI